ncbi:NADP-dependent oxidoreductase [Fructilactobacillus sp. Tb1]|uniref:NADP-dependent oxidoreductase n=1 Tax=Fructilactobacillus sp. Tb1 TaxID=3422304 RepID=UPI003D2D3E41
MKAYQFNKYHHPAKFQEIVQPKPQANEVLIKIKAAGLNPVDLKIQAGKMKILMHYHLPLTMGNELAGEVMKIGNQVTDFKVGDRVYARPSHAYTGTLTEMISLPINQIAHMPADLDYVSASGIPLTGLTSYQALIELGHVQPGQKVFIQAGAGGIGTIAIQIAKALGAYVATTASSANVKLVRELGADQVINYQTDYFADVLQNYDLAFDTLGGKYLADSFKILKPGAKLITINGLPDYKFGRTHGFSLAKSLLFGLASHKLTRLAKKADVQYDFLLMHASGQQLQMLTTMVEQHQLTPIIDSVYQFEDVAKAYQKLAKGHTKGKLIVKNI